MLRLGCSGCLIVIILLAGVILGAWGLYEMVQRPDVGVVETTPADGVRAQQKIFDLVRRAGSGRPRTTTLSERELNAFLRGHLGNDADLPLRGITVHLRGPAAADIAGHLPVRQLATSALTSVLPGPVLEHRIWLTIVTTATVEIPDAGRERRRLRLDVTRFQLGRQRLPTIMLRVLLDPAALGFLRWPLPTVIDDVRIEPGRLIIETAG